MNESTQIHQMNRVKRPTPTYQAARQAARETSLDELSAWLERLEVDLAAIEAGEYDDGLFPAETREFARFLATERLDAVRHEHDLRIRLAATSPKLRELQEQNHDKWRDLAAAVCARTDLPELLRSLGFDLTCVGSNGRRNSREYAGACPICGGYDRFRVWEGRDARAWCRVCLWRADAITVVRSFAPGFDSFRDAVRYLAERLAVAI